MSSHLDAVPFSGIIRIRDMMYGVRDPFRLDQGDVSFDAPDTLKAAMRRAIDDNRTHYVQTTGVPRLLELLAEKLRRVNGMPIGSPDEVMVTNGGIHALYLLFQALLEPGDEVVVPDPEWPPCAGNIAAAQGRAGALSAARASRLAVRPRRARIEDHAAHARHLHQLAAQPDRRRAHPQRRRSDRRDRPRARSLADLRRSLRGRRLRRRGAREPGVAARNVRADDSGLHVQQDLRDDRAAAGLSRGARCEAARADEEGRSSTRRATCRRSCSTAASARSRDRRSASRPFGRSCRRGAISSTPAWRRAPAACSPAAAERRVLRVPADRSALDAIGAGDVRSRSRGRWPSTSSRAAGSAASRASTSAPPAKATSASASRATGASWPARWSRCDRCLLNQVRIQESEFRIQNSLLTSAAWWRRH